MSTDRDTTRIVRSWLRTDEHESADRVLDAVLDRIDTTPQRRAFWPARRFADMNTFAKIAIAAAAALVVAFIGLNVLPASDGGGLGGPADSPSSQPSSSPSPTAPPTPSPTPDALFPAAGELAAGTHSFVVAGVPFSLTVPTSAWTSNGEFGIDRGDVGPDGAGFIFWLDSPDGVYADPCGQVQAPPAGPSASDLATALTTIPGTDLVSGPSDVTVGGRPAKLVVLTVREDVDCGAGESGFHLWYDEDIGGRYATQLGSTIRVWIIDAPGGLLWIDGETYQGASAEAEQELQQIMDSITFD